LADGDVESYFIVSDAKKDNIYWNKLNLPNDRIVCYNKLMNRYRSVNYKETRKHIFISSYYRYSKNKNARNITVVHDFTYEFFSKGLRKFIHHWQKMKAIYKSEKVICISNNTQNDLKKFAKNNVDSIVVYNGISSNYRLMNDEDKTATMELFESNIAEIIQKKKFVLFVGQRSGYKNWKEAVKLFKQLPNEYYMISVGGKELSKEESELLGEAQSRHFKLNNIAEEQLCLLYNNAYCLLYLSEYEGFGLPVAEATQCGCPVVAMNRSSIPEIANENSLVYMVEKIEFLPLDLKHGDSVNRFSWNDTYKKIIYESCDL
jgi:mannosyltransferase